MNDNSAAVYAKLEALSKDIENQANSLTELSVAYLRSLKALPGPQPDPPRPFLEGLVRADQILQLLISTQALRNLPM